MGKAITFTLNIFMNEIVFEDYFIIIEYGLNFEMYFFSKSMLFYRQFKASFLVLLTYFKYNKILLGIFINI